MAIEKRLSGEDSQFFTAALQAVIEGPETELDEGFYRILAKGTTSELPVALDVGDWFYSDGTQDLANGDDVLPVNEVLLAEVTSWDTDFTRSEIDTTTLIDRQKSYRSGKPELSGSFDGIHFVGGSSEQVTQRNRLVAQFIDVITHSSTGVIEKIEATDELLWFFGYTNKTTEPGEVQEVAILPIRLTNFSPVGAQMDQAQTITATFRVDGRERPQLYQYTVPEPSGP